MEVQEKIQKLLEISPQGFQFSDSFFTDDCELITDFNISTNRIWFFTSGTASCGCCPETIDHIEDLDWFLERMSESSFEEFVEWLIEKSK